MADVLPLPFIEGTPDAAFLKLSAESAGRKAWLVLNSPGVTKYCDENGIEGYEDRKRAGAQLVSRAQSEMGPGERGRNAMIRIGRAAQRLERLGYDWRQAENLRHIVLYHKSLFDNPEVSSTRSARS